MGTTVFFRARRVDGESPPREQTGGPPEEDETARRTEKRLGFVERRLDRIARRVSRLEEVVAADAIAPMGEAPPEDGQSR